MPPPGPIGPGYGYLDLLFINFLHAEKTQMEAYLYWGSAAGFDVSFLDRRGSGLNEQAFAAAWAKGRALPLERVIASALQAEANG